MKRLLIVDDHPVFRNGLRQAVAGMNEFGEILEAGSSAEALALIERGGIDLVMVDIGLPDASGMDIVEAKAGLPGSPRFFIMTMEADASLALRAFRAGASGFASKNLSLGVLTLAVRLVAAGELYVEGEILRDMLTSEAQLPGERPDLKERLESLTDRERAVLDAVLEGLSAKEAASRLGVSYRTAENYQSAVYAKMGARTAVDLVRLAMGAGVPLPG